MIEIKNFTKKYPNGYLAVENLNLKIEPGDLFAFIGHNGAGKTTTIKCLVGLLDFNEGEILIDKLSVKDNPLECKKKIAYIPDNPDIYENITGIAYLNLIANVFKMSKEDRANQIKTLAKDFGLDQHLTEYISTYSHGMKQKLVLIASFMHHPQVMILDEPFVGLDPKAAYVVKQKMQEMCNQGGSIFFSTHVLEVAQKLCNKIAIIKKGQLLRSGLMSEVIGDQSLENVFLELTDE